MEISMKELAKEAMNIEFEHHVPASKQRTSTTKWEISQCDYPDIVVTKTMATATKILVLMPSQNSCYIKIMRKNQEPVFEKLNTNNLRDFFQGMASPLIVEDGMWIRQFESGVEFARNFMTYLTYAGVFELIRNHAAPVFNSVDDVRYGRRYSTDRLHNADNAFKLYAPLFKVATTKRQRTFLTKETELMNFIVSNFGIDNAKDFIEELNVSLVDVNDNRFSWVNKYRFDQLAKCNFAYKQFKDYVLYQSVRMGYADEMLNFFTDWNDTLKMQMDLYGKIKEKYMEYLPYEHMRLGYISRVRHKEIEKEKFLEQSKITQKFQRTIGDYVFIAPKSPDDFYDEAVQQANCLASCVDKYADGHDHIIFMRKKDTPDVSLVTIELSPDGTKVWQKYQARNRKVTEEQEAIINKWMEDINK